MTERTPRLAGDLFRVWICTGIGFVASLASTFVYGLQVVLGDVTYDRWTATIVSTLALIIVLFGTYQILTWRAFARWDGTTLRSLVRRTNPRTRTQRWQNLISGSGPKSWSLAASATALLAVVLVIFDAGLRANPFAILASALTIALGWTMIVFAFTTTYLRGNSEGLNQLEFPDRDRDHPPVWRDYFYLAVQVSTTFSSSDVTVRTTRMRGLITSHSIVAFIFNTVIIALVVSAIVIVAG